VDQHHRLASRIDFIAQLGVAAALAGTVGCASASALHELLISDRPDFTESTSIVVPGAVQAEGGYTFSRAGPEKESAFGELLVRFSLTHFAELRIEPGSYTHTTAPGESISGREDGEIGAKLRLHNAGDDPSPIPAVALVFGSTVSTGTRSLRDSHSQPEVKLSSEWTITDKIGLATNVDVARPVADGRRYTEYSASASFGFELSPKVGTFAEAFGFAPQLSGAKHTRYLDTGVTASLSPNFQVDLRVGVGLNHAGPDYFLGAGLVRRW